MNRRRTLLTLACALALLFAWSALPRSHAADTRPTSARPAPASPRAARPAVRDRAPATSAASTGIAACDDFVARTMTCAQLPDDAKIAIAEASKAWAELTAVGPRPDLEASCRATASVQGEALAAMGC